MYIRDAEISPKIAVAAMSPSRSVGIPNPKSMSESFGGDWGPGVETNWVTVKKPLLLSIESWLFNDGILMSWFMK